MRTTLPLGVLLAIGATLVHPRAALAQPPPDPKFVQVDYMKVVEGKYPEYRKLEEIWKALHQERAKKGQIESWSLYLVAMPPYSTSREYDAVTVTVYGAFAKMGSPFDEAQIAKIQSFPPATDSRKIVRSEVWSVYRTAGSELFASPFATVLFHKARPGQLADYLRVQTEQYAPINAELVKSGVRHAWHSLGITYPSGTRREYDWVTFDGFDKFEAPVGNTAAGIAPERLAAASKAVGAYRDTIKNEYWRLLDRVGPK